MADVDQLGIALIVPCRKLCGIQPESQRNGRKCVALFNLVTLVSIVNRRRPVDARGALNHRLARIVK